MFAVPQRSSSATTQRGRIEDAIGDDAAPLVMLAEQSGVEDVITNADGKIWVRRRGIGFRHEGDIDPDCVGGVLARIAKLQRLPFSEEHPVLETDLPLPESPAHGSRITGVQSPITRETIIAIRPQPTDAFPMEDYRDCGIFKPKGETLNDKPATQSFLNQAQGLSHYEILSCALDNYLNVIVAGPTGSGKTSLVSSLLSRIGKTKRDRVVAIQDTRELRLADIQNHSDLLATDAVPMKKCLKTTLRLSPHRIVVGEVRDEAALILLDAWNTGHSGGIASLHSNSARNALLRLETITPIDDIVRLRTMIADAVHLVVFIDREPRIPAGRQVKEVVLVDSYDRERNDYNLVYL